jgi:hypothetical protein
MAAAADRCQTVRARAASTLLVNDVRWSADLLSEFVPHLPFGGRG